MPEPVEGKQTMSVADVPTILYELLQDVRARHPDRPALIGVSGAQGSGKTTACQLLAMANQPRFAQFSIDDVYFDAAQRWALAERTHPLFATRGPPGTHDIALARATIETLRNAGPDSATPLPRFDKIRDIMRPHAEWPTVRGRPEAILIDAWCLGALPQRVSLPLNAAENEDAKGVWRQTQDDFLRNSYGDWFRDFDAIVYLQAPNWEVVRRWRGQQEVTLRGRPLTAEEDAWIDRFVMHYERITRSMMAGAHMAGTIVRLDEDRNLLGVEQK